jgi:alanine-glyoxylate transaminase/serine-glyoxylate transaminase/serine-pyruvate transaminase
MALRLASRRAAQIRPSLRLGAAPIQHLSTAPAAVNAIYAEAPSPLQEFSVVYTDRALNHMSEPFKKAMLEIGDTLKEVYNCDHAVIIPGSGTYAMEAAARQFATGKKAIVLRNGFFSYRWTQIFESCGIPTDHLVLKAQAVDDSPKPQFAPHPVDQVVETIMKEKPAVLFAPHVETSTGMILPDDYIKKVADAMHSVGGIMVLDCIASGTVWVDMKKLGVDALISAPQKGCASRPQFGAQFPAQLFACLTPSLHPSPPRRWTGPSCAGLVMMNERAADVARATRSSSFVCDLRKWLELMESYEAGGFMYHATMPTDALVTFRDVMMETRDFGFDNANDAAWDLGRKVHSMMCEEKGLTRVAAPGYQAAGVIVVHTEDAQVAGAPPPPPPPPKQPPAPPPPPSLLSPPPPPPPCTGRGQVHPGGHPDRRGRPLHDRRARRHQDLPHRPLRPRQAQGHRQDRQDPPRLAREGGARRRHRPPLGVHQEGEVDGAELKSASGR